MPTRQFISLFVLVFCCASCSAETIPFALSDKGWDKQLDSSLQKKWHSFGQVKLYKTTLDQVEGIYGEADRFKSDKKNYSPDLLCYSSEDDYVVVFQSGPLGGWSIVTGILIAEKSQYHDERCKRSLVPQGSPGIAELKIGDSEEKVYYALGRPSFKENDFLAYRYEREGGPEIPLSYDVYITSGIEIGLNKNRISWLRVYWQEST